VENEKIEGKREGGNEIVRLQEAVHNPKVCEHRRVRLLISTCPTSFTKVERTLKFFTMKSKVLVDTLDMCTCIEQEHWCTSNHP
jgi:hypothetical protein